MMDPKKPIAYFCAEYAAEDSLPIYAGGLGILSGDLLREAGEERIPWVAIGLFYQRGFSDQLLNPRIFGFELLKNKDHGTLQLPVEIYDRTAYAHVWHKQYGTAALYLLDTNTELNSNEDRL